MHYNAKTPDFLFNRIQDSVLKISLRISSPGRAFDAKGTQIASNVYLFKLLSKAYYTIFDLLVTF